MMTHDTVVSVDLLRSADLARSARWRWRAPLTRTGWLHQQKEEAVATEGQTPGGGGAPEFINNKKKK